MGAGCSSSSPCKHEQISREVLLVLLSQKHTARNSRYKEHPHTWDQIWTITFKVHFENCLKGQSGRAVQAMKVWEQTTSQAWTGLSWTLTTSNAKPENTKPKNIQWNEKESVSQWASQISMHQGGDIHIQSIWGWQGGGFVLRIVIFLLAAVTPHRAQSFDASLCHKGFSTAYCLPSSQNSRRKPAVTFLPPLLHHIHPWSVLLKTSWKYAINSNLRHAFRAFKNNLFKAKHQRKSKVTEV